MSEHVQSDIGEAAAIGRNLRQLRRSAGLSQRDIAELLGVSYQQVQKYEKGDNRFPVEKLLRLKHFYNVSYEAFFWGCGSMLQSVDSRDDAFLLTRLSAIEHAHVKSRIYRIVDILLEEVG